MFSWINVTTSSKLYNFRSQTLKLTQRTYAKAPVGLCACSWSRVFVILDNVANQKVGRDSLYVYSVNVEYIRDNILGTYDGDYEDVFWDVMPCNLMDT